MIIRMPNSVRLHANIPPVRIMYDYDSNYKASQSILSTSHNHQCPPPIHLRTTPSSHSHHHRNHQRLSMPPPQPPPPSPTHSPSHFTATRGNQLASRKSRKPRQPPTPPQSHNCLTDRRQCQQHVATSTGNRSGSDVHRPPPPPQRQRTPSRPPKRRAPVS